jgi:hypothetical protein
MNFNEAAQVYLLVVAGACVTAATLIYVSAAVSFLRLRRYRTTFPAFEGVRIAPVAAERHLYHWRQWDKLHPEWGDW